VLIVLSDIHLFYVFVVQTIDDNGQEIPLLDIPDKKSRFGSRKIPMYVKHAFPAVVDSDRKQNHSFFPPIPGAEENFGMIYNKPETEAEKNMQDLWLARRRQEVAAFNLMIIVRYFPYFNHRCVFIGI
jgi:hypothetical protein